MTWIIELKRDIRFENLQDFDPNWLLFGIMVDPYRDDITDYFLTSPHLERYRDAPAAVNTARDLSLLINGVFEIFAVEPTLHMGTHRMLCAEPLREIGRFSVWPAGLEFTMPYSALDEGWVNWRRTEREFRSTVSGNFCALCLHSKKIRNIALTFGYLGVNWISLFSALEHLDLSDRDMIERYGITNAQLSAFRGTANNFSILGPAARHGAWRGAPPRRQTTLAEAREFVMGLVRREAQILAQQPEFLDAMTLIHRAD
ncbi:hypothetical protein [Haematobacter sp.]|uniref:hypothetical protein n=1 Tax=Haematobacter sp. TaxID=2953762 RepID=UPI0028AD12E9|nr:hypothetical protein [Haematobacter sp.]